MLTASGTTPPPTLKRTPHLTRASSRLIWTAGLVLAFLLLPAVIGIFHTNADNLFYPYLAVASLLGTGYCLAAGVRRARERKRWQILAMAQFLHALVYTDAALHQLHFLSYSISAWFGNVAIAASMTLLLPALLSVRIGRGRLLRILDSLLVVIFGVVLTCSLGSGELAGDSMTRVWTSILVLSLLSALALVTRFSQANIEIQHFTDTVSKTIWVDLLTTLLVNWICFTWFPDTPYAVLAPLAALTPLLLCYWSVQPGTLRGPGWFTFDRTIVDSLQPSVLTLCSVILVLSTFPRRPVLIGFLVVLVVLLHATRTQVFYSRLFRERHKLRTETEHLHKLATRDPLTGIANRRWFEQMLVERLADPFAYPCSLLMVDTDRFKEVNDSQGHTAGDAALCMVADVLQRETDGMAGVCVSRIGGDEFAVLLPCSTQEHAKQCAERIRIGVEELGHTRCHGVTVSIGVATLPTSGTRSELLQAADQALYRAKSAGRNAVCT